MDIRSLVRASYDPGRFSTAYHREKKALKQNLAESVAAEGAPFGSVAANNDPTATGSAARRQFANVFGSPGGSDNPIGDALSAPKSNGVPAARAALSDAAAPSDFNPASMYGPTTMPGPWLPGGRSFPGSTPYRFTSPTSMARGTLGQASSKPLFYRRPGGR